MSVTENIKVDLSASLVFAMILIYKLSMDDARQPAQPQADSFRISVVFREDALTRSQTEQLWPIIQNWTVYNPWVEWSQQIANDVPTVSEVTYLDGTNQLFSGPFPPSVDLRGLAEVFRTDLLVPIAAAAGEPNAPSTTAGWRCGVEPVVRVPEEHMRYVTDDADQAVQVAIVGSEDFEIRHRLSRLTSGSFLVPMDDTDPEVDLAAAIQGAVGAIPPLSLPPTFYTPEISTLVCDSGQQLSPFAPTSANQSNASNLCFNAPFTEFADALAYAGSDPLPPLTDPDDPAGDRYQYFASAVLERAPFATFSCEASSSVLNQTDSIYLFIDGTDFRGIDILAMSVLSRSYPEPRIWTAWGADPFPGRIEPGAYSLTEGNARRLTSGTMIEVRL
ncbi:hypothetical protein [Fluviibacterium sp. S390]|uniref:hypothetical protein n=1 Tax=Fluviibacterium sp. S390 TaxID=3415139 RepID=UPI003C7C5E09